MHFLVDRYIGGRRVSVSGTRERARARRLPFPRRPSKGELSVFKGFRRIPLDIVTRKIFYGWYIVGVGFICYLNSSFALSSTLSVFMKPLTSEFGVSRGIFSFIRSGEVMFSSVIAFLVGPLIDRYGARWLIVTGALVAGTGYILLSQAHQFWQFMVVRWLPITVGDTLMGYMVINVMISRWFIRKRGRAISIANMGNGIAKATIPLVAVGLFALVGWRNTWMVFGLVTFAMVVLPAFLLVRRSPEDMGLQPDGALAPPEPAPGESPGPEALRTHPADVEWTRSEAVRTSTFWLLVVTYGTVTFGIIGLNLHIHPYITDIGYSPEIASAVMGMMALTQTAGNLVWGVVGEHLDVRKAAATQFLLQACGLALAIAYTGLASVSVGFLIYGFGLGGILVIRELLWANYFGRVSLGRVRNLGIMITRTGTTVGPPFFGFFHDYTGSYFLSFGVFIAALLLSALLVLAVRPPRKADSGPGGATFRGTP